MRLLKAPKRSKKLSMEQGYARIEGEAVLQHESRSELLRLVQAHPGMNLQDVCARIRLARGPTQWHLDKLTRNGYLTRVRHGGESLFFPRAMPPQQVKSLAALRHPSRRELLSLAAKRSGLRPSEAARELSLRPPTIRHHARELLDLGLLAQHGDERVVRYLPTQAGLELLALLDAIPAA